MTAHTINESPFFTYDGEIYILNKHRYHDKKQLMTFVNGTPTVITYRVNDCFINMPGLETILPSGIYCKKGKVIMYFELKSDTMENDIVKYCWNGATLKRIRQPPKYQVKKLYEANLLVNFYNASK